MKLSGSILYNLEIKHIYTRVITESFKTVLIDAQDYSENELVLFQSVFSESRILLLEPEFEINKLVDHIAYKLNH